MALLWTAGPAPAAQAPDARAELHPERARRLLRIAGAGRDLTPERWPDGRRVAVALTVDLDGELVWLDDLEQATPGELSRGAFGQRRGLPRILALLERRSIPATFFIPALMLELHPEALGAVQSSGRHEIGFHGYAHESVITLSEAEERSALERGLALFRTRGLVPRSYRSPSWDFSRATLGLLRQAGFRVDSSLMGDDRPYELLQEGEPTGIVELPVDWSLDDWPHFQLEWDAPLPVRSPGEVLALWRAEFDAIRGEGGVYVLTLHPQVIGRGSRIALLERLLDHVEASGGAWYATLAQIAEHLAPALSSREADAGAR